MRLDELEFPIECDISKDRTWKGQYYCGLHAVHFRDDDDSENVVLCPAAVFGWEVARHYEQRLKEAPEGENERRLKRIEKSVDDIWRVVNLRNKLDPPKM